MPPFGCVWSEARHHHIVENGARTSRVTESDEICVACVAIAINQPSPIAHPPRGRQQRELAAEDAGDQFFVVALQNCHSGGGVDVITSGHRGGDFEIEVALDRQSQMQPSRGEGAGDCGASAGAKVPVAPPVARAAACVSAANCYLLPLISPINLAIP